MERITVDFLIETGFVKDPTRNTRWSYKSVGGTLGGDKFGLLGFYFFGSNLRFEYEQDILFIVGLIDGITT